MIIIAILGISFVVVSVIFYWNYRRLRSIALNRARNDELRTPKPKYFGQ
jgi:hypothetical protein